MAQLLNLSTMEQAINMYIDYTTSPLGIIEIQATNQGITQLIFCGDDKKPTNSNPIINACKAQLAEYFANTRQTFDLPLTPKGTDFQKSVWHALTKIPHGKTVSYKDISLTINNPKASQAVGGANGRNPISIIIPCHRVVGTNGTLTGYAGGLSRKQWLLNHETTPQKNILLNIKDTRQSKTQFLN